MNGKKIACVVLMMIVAAVAYSMQIMQQKAKATAKEAQSAEQSANSANMTKDLSFTKLKTLEYNIKDLRQFFDEWKPVLSKMKSGQDAELAVMSLVRNSGILVVSQKFEVKENRDNRFIPRLMQGTLVLQDEYAKTLNWLGELERRIPMARLTSCRVKQGETSRQVNLEVRFDIPLMNLDAEMEAK